MRAFVLAVCCGLLTASCLNDVAGPRTVILVAVGSEEGDSAVSGTPGQPLPYAIRYRAVDLEGRPQIGATVTWTVAGQGARVDSGSDVTDAAGELSGQWVLGKVAAEPQVLTIRVQARGFAVQVERLAVAVPHEVSTLAVEAETLALRVGSVHPIPVFAVDPFGNRFSPPGLEVRALDTGIVRVEGGLSLRVLQRGWVDLVAETGAFAVTIRINAMQVVDHIDADADTIVFHSLNQAVTLPVRLIDDLGQVVADSAPSVIVQDSAVVGLATSALLELRSRENGVTRIVVAVPEAERELVAYVAQQAVEVALSASDVGLDALSDTTRLTYVALDGGGMPVANAQVSFGVEHDGVATVDQAGLVTAVGNGTTAVVALAANGAADTSWVTVRQRATQVVPSADSLAFSALGAELTISATAFDRLGSAVVAPQIVYHVEDSTIARADPAGRVHALRNGSTRLQLAADSVSAGVTVVVAQRAHHVVVADTLHFSALGDSLDLPAVAVDSLGSAVPLAVTEIAVSDPGIVQSAGASTLVAVSNGAADVSFTVGGLAGHTVVAVRQVPAFVTASVAASQPILSLALDAPIPLVCQVSDRRGVAMAVQPTVLPSPAGRWTGTTCDGLRIRTSGFDTLRVVHDGVEARVPVVLAVRATVDQPLGSWLDVDSLPTGKVPWAPSARRNSRGEFEVYFAGYPTNPKVTADHRADLHRLVSTDGVHFRYDGVALRRSDDNCAPDGSGIENVSIVRRSDGPGWRMFYAGGSFVCYGWQVFSAVSDDERTWTKEPGVRIDNGGQLPPAPPNYAPWPAGEGMVTELLPSGEWRMIISSYERIMPYEDKFQITEWRSPDQLRWTYIGPVLTTRQMPPEASATIYSPTTREIAPGLFRMVFAGDNRGTPGWRGRLWSALSTDQRTWQVEGVLMGGETTKLWYCALLDDRLVFIREDDGAGRRLAVATVRMP